MIPDLDICRYADPIRPSGSSSCWLFAAGFFCKTPASGRAGRALEPSPPGRRSQASVPSGKIIAAYLPSTSLLSAIRAHRPLFGQGRL